MNASNPESEPEQLPAPAKTDQVPGEPASSSRPAGGVPLVLALIALGLAIGLAATAYFTWNQVQQLNSAQAGVDARVENHLQPLRQSPRQSLRPSTRV